MSTRCGDWHLCGNLRRHFCRFPTNQLHKEAAEAKWRVESLARPAKNSTKASSRRLRDQERSQDPSKIAHKLLSKNLEDLALDAVDRLLKESCTRGFWGVDLRR
eukprot:g4206.t1